MKSIILILLIDGLMLLVKGYTENYKNCPLPKDRDTDIYLVISMKNKLLKIISKVSAVICLINQIRVNIRKSDADVSSKVNNSNFINESDYDTESES